MYIKQTAAYYRGTEQCARRGLFLLLIQPAGIEGTKKPIKALVRKVALRQCGHWMMGTARVYGHSLTVSGAYGADGLVMEAPDEVYNRAPVELPSDLAEQWNNGGGWNSAGSEGPAIRQWARENLKALQR